MWTVAHSTFGAAVAGEIRKPWLAGAAGVLSHSLLDLIPHWDYAGLVPLRVWIAVDQLLAALILFWVLKGNKRWKSALAAAFMAAIPDIEGAFMYLGWQKKYYFLSHMSGFPHGATGNILFGTLTQVFIILSCIFLILRQKKNVFRSA